MVKKLSQSIREYKKYAILTPICVAAEVILEIIIPLLMANLIDDGIYGGEMNMVYKIGLELILCAVLSLIFGMLSGKFAAKAWSGFAKNLRKDLYYKVQDFSFTNIDFVLSKQISFIPLFCNSIAFFIVTLTYISLLYILFILEILFTSYHS